MNGGSCTFEKLDNGRNQKMFQYSVIWMLLSSYLLALGTCNEEKFPKFWFYRKGLAELHLMMMIQCDKLNFHNVRIVIIISDKFAIIKYTLVKAYNDWAASRFTASSVLFGDVAKSRKMIIKAHELRKFPLLLFDPEKQWSAAHLMPRVFM